MKHEENEDFTSWDLELYFDQFGGPCCGSTFGDFYVVGNF